MSTTTGANQGNIINSFATGDVTGEADKTGGFIGSINNNVTGVISNSYATGNVSGNTKVGGFVGEALSPIITNVYAVGNVSGNTDVGGLVGFCRRRNLLLIMAIGIEGVAEQKRVPVARLGPP